MSGALDTSQFGTFALPDDAPQSPAAPVGGAPAAGPASTPAGGQPQGVIDSSGASDVPWDENADYKPWMQTIAQKSQRVLSPRGDYRELSSEVPTPEELFAQDPRTQRLRQGEEFISTIADPKMYQKAKTMLDNFKRTISNDAKLAHKEKLAQVQRTYATELNKSDPVDNSTQAIQQRVADLKLASDAYMTDLEKLKNHPDPKEKAKGELAEKIAPHALLGKTFDTFAMQIAQKSRLPGSAAYEAMVLMTTPVIQPKMKGFNGLTGRGGALYDVDGSDPAGNVIVRLPNRMRVVMPRDTFQALEDARYKAYDIAKQYNAQRAEAQRKADQPGVLGRAMEGAYNWMTGR